jgi:putative transposase
VRTGFLVCGYVLMPDHWHALLLIRNPLTISRSVQQIKYISARKLNRHRKRKGTIWLHQFWDRFVRSKKEFGARMNYMKMNPVRKGLVSLAEDWPWSSFWKELIDRGGSTVPIIHINRIDLPEDHRG